MYVALVSIDQMKKNPRHLLKYVLWKVYVLGFVIFSAHKQRSKLKLDTLIFWPIFQVVDEIAGSDTTCSRYNQYVNQKIIRNISVNISKTLGLEAIYPVRKMTFILNT